ncbi:MAG: DUF5305 family protein [Fervidicoccaceae archaeon]
MHRGFSSTRYFPVLVIGIITIVFGVTLAYLALSTQPYRTVSQVIIDDKIESNTTILLVLLPNDIYENKTVIAEPGKNYYANLVDSICIYYSASSRSGNISGEVTIGVYLWHPDGWGKTIKIEKATFMSPRTTYSSPCISLKDIINYVDYLSSQANIRTYYFDLSIEAISNLNITYPNQSIQEKMNNTLLIRVDKAKNLLTVSGEESKHKDIRKTSNVTLENKVLSMSVSTARSLSVISTVIGALLIASAVLGGTGKPGATSQAHRFEKKYRNIIVEAKEVPVNKEKTILLQSEADLLRVARILGKPILKTRHNERDVYVVSDGEFFYILEILG